MEERLQLGRVDVNVRRKEIKNLHLSVHPPTGHVTISAPAYMPLDRVRVFAVSKLDWIKSQQKKLQEQIRETPRAYLERESHYLWGKRYLLSVEEAEQAPTVRLRHGSIVLRVRPSTTTAKREATLEGWYREELKKAVPPLVQKWEPTMGVKVDSFHIQRMKTKWGSCSPQRQAIRLNTELAKKPPQCLEYLVVHEMAHLIEPTHNQRFVGLMDRFMPQWRHVRSILNELPVRHEKWRY